MMLLQAHLSDILQLDRVPSMLNSLLPEDLLLDALAVLVLEQLSGGGEPWKARVDLHEPRACTRWEPGWLPLVDVVEHAHASPEEPLCLAAHHAPQPACLHDTRFLDGQLQLDRLRGTGHELHEELFELQLARVATCPSEQLQLNPEHGVQGQELGLLGGELRLVCCLGIRDVKTHHKTPYQTS